VNTSDGITRAGYIGDKQNKSKQLHLKPCRNALHLLFGAMLSKYIGSVKDKRSFMLVWLFII